MSDVAPLDPSTDRNLLFGVLALQADLIDQAHFAEGCVLWTSHKAVSLADLLVQRGWLTSEDRARVEYLLGRKLQKHAGDVRASLTEVVTNRVRNSLGEVSDADIRQSLYLTTLAPREEVVGPTTAPIVSTRDRYSILRLHATGGIGRVWLAHDQTLGRDVALKDLRPEWAGRGTITARFLREARITGQLEHPGIVPIYEMGGDSPDQSPFYTMRFVRGRTLSEAVVAYHERQRQSGVDSLGQRELLTAFVGVCNAVAYAHSRGVLHRDLKPQNVVLGGFGEVFVLDWGLARVTDQPDGEDDAPPLDAIASASTHATVQGQVLGTPAYMAPEQAAGRLDQLGPATDVYGLGAVLYEILTGQPPARVLDSDAILHKILHGEISRPRSIAPATPPVLEAICLKALSKNPTDRYEGAAALARDLERYFADEPIAIFREPALARAARWTRRHRTGVTAAAAGVLVAIVCLAAASAFLLAAYREADRQRDAARIQSEVASQERDKARENFRLARSAVDEFDTRVSESPELKEHGLELLRGRLLESAVDFYQKFVREESSDPAVRAEQGRAYKRLAGLERTLDHNDKAQLAYEHALAIFQNLADALPRELGYSRELAECHYKLGLLQHDTGHLALAEGPYQQALALDRRLAEAQPDVAAYQRNLAEVQHGLARLYRDTNRPSVAEPLYESALTLRRQLAQGHPNEPTFQEDLGWTLFNLGNLYGRTSRPELSEKAYNETLTVWKSLSESQPAVPAFANEVAMTLNNLGNLYADTARPARAEAAHKEALAVRQKLSDTHPAVTEYREDLAKSHTNLGTIYLASGQLGLAEHAYRQALSIRQRLVDEHPEVLDYASNHADTESQLGMLMQDRGQLLDALEWFGRALTRLAAVLKKEPEHADALEFRHETEARLAVALSRLGRQTEAKQALGPGADAKTQSLETQLCRILVRAYAGESAGVLEEANAMSRKPELSGRDLFDLACVYALANDGARAMELLGKARLAGYFGSAATVSRLRTDLALSGLHSRDDYRGVLGELEKKTKHP
jgi:eukaryotic-like serine/threonine-protein kinase